MPGIYNSLQVSWLDLILSKPNPGALGPQRLSTAGPIRPRPAGPSERSTLPRHADKVHRCGSEAGSEISACDCLHKSETRAPADAHHLPGQDRGFKQRKKLLKPCAILQFEESILHCWQCFKIFLRSTSDRLCTGPHPNHCRLWAPWDDESGASLIFAVATSWFVEFNISLCWQIWINLWIFCLTLSCEACTWEIKYFSTCDRPMIITISGWIFWNPFGQSCQLTNGGGRPCTSSWPKMPAKMTTPHDQSIQVVWPKLVALGALCCRSKMIWEGHLLL